MHEINFPVINPAPPTPVYTVPLNTGHLWEDVQIYGRNFLACKGNLEGLPESQASGAQVQAGRRQSTLEPCGAAVLCQPLSSLHTFRWHVTCPELWKYLFWDHIPEPVSVFLLSQTGANLKLGSLSRRCNAPEVTPSPFAGLYFAGGFTHLCHNWFPAQTAQAPALDTSTGWGLLKCDPRHKSLSPACKLSLKSPTAALFQATASEGGCWPRVTSLKQALCPSSTQGNQRTERKDGFRVLSLKHRKEKPQLKQRESAILPCVTQKLSCFCSKPHSWSADRAASARSLHQPDIVLGSSRPPT